MKKTFVFSVYFLLTATTLISQNWSEWGKFTCFEGFSFRVMSKGYNQHVNKYEWKAEVKNNYSKRVHINMFWKVGNEEKSIGRFSIEPGAVTNAVSYYFTSSENYLYVSAKNVCFGDNWLSCDGTQNCYAICDKGTPNVPADCSGKPTTSDNRQPVTSENKDKPLPSSQPGKSFITKNPVTDGKYLARIICRKTEIDDKILEAMDKGDDAQIKKLEAELEKLDTEHIALNKYYQERSDLFEKFTNAYEAELKKICSYYFPG